MNDTHKTTEYTASVREYINSLSENELIEYASISTTNGFFSLLCDTRLLRSNSLLLYSLICVAMPGLSMPELAGSN